jgi:hypothetical protein
LYTFLQTYKVVGVTPGFVISIVVFCNSDFSFIEMLTSFSNIHENYKDMQKGIFGTCVVNDAPYVIKFKTMQLY